MFIFWFLADYLSSCAVARRVLGGSGEPARRFRITDGLSVHDIWEKKNFFLSRPAAQAPRQRPPLLRRVAAEHRARIKMEAP